MSVYHWTCPYCDRDTTIRKGDIQIYEREMTTDNADGYRSLISTFIICPNPKCQRLILEVDLYEIKWNEGKEVWDTINLIKKWKLVPPSRAKAFPGYIPQVILDDYNEACLICDLSPKASATLSRRCLQGILRDFWGVKPGRLIDEIEQIKDKMDPLTWEAIDSVRQIGNIGAHMEKDINLIIDVDPQEAELLVGLIEMLLKDWYVSREKRKERLEAIKEIASSKDQQKKEEIKAP